MAKSTSQIGGQSPQDVRTQLVGPFLSWLRAHGQDPGLLVQRFQLPADAESLPELSLPLPTLRAFLEAAEQRSGDSFIGLHVAQSFKRGTYGLVEYIARASPTLRDTFRRLARYMALLNDRMVASFHEDATTGTFTYGVPGEPLSYGRHANEFGLALFVHGGRQLTEQPWNPLAVTFAHPAPPDFAPLTAFFGVTPSFGGGLNVLTLAASTLDLSRSSSTSALAPSSAASPSTTPPSRMPSTQCVASWHSNTSATPTWASARSPSSSATQSSAPSIAPSSGGRERRLASSAVEPWRLPPGNWRLRPGNPPRIPLPSAS